LLTGFVISLCVSLYVCPFEGVKKPFLEQVHGSKALYNTS
jgi:hypothetical protein